MQEFLSTTQVLVFLQTDLGIGGIENYIYSTFCLLRNSDVKLIWISGKKSYIDPAYRDVFDNGTVEVWENKIDADALRKMTFGKKNARIIFVSSYINWFVMAENFKRECDWCSVENFFFVNHFTGWMNYMETACPRFIRKLVQRRLSDIFSAMIKNENIRFFSPTHIAAMEEHYDIEVKRDFKELCVPRCTTIGEFDADHAREIYDRPDFNILAVSRFEFPHKGFLIGLIRVFGELKKEYPQLRMTIVGYGNGENIVKETIAALSENARKAVSLCGSCSPEKLKVYYRDADLNIGVAGCCCNGARIGTLSLPARNYCMECETYGYGNIINNATRSDPGEPVKPYIEEILKMPRSEYIQRCKDCFDSFAEKNKDDDFITNIRNKTNTTLKKSDCRFAASVFRFVMLKTKGYVIRRAVKQNGGLLKTMRKHF